MENEEITHEIQKLKTKRALYNIKIIPWFMGFSNDLMFYIAINTLFFTTVKNLTASQISFITTISCLSYILLQRLFLKITKNIGNTKSVRIGTLILLLGSIMITFCKSYYLIMIGHALYTVSFLFKSMDNIILKNDLTYLNKEDEYIKYKNKSNIIYSIVTTVIALCSGYLFKINHFLPMYLCIAVCLINVIISFKLTDENEELTKRPLVKNSNKQKISFNKVILLIMISYGLFYATISTGQTNVKLFIQYNLEKYFEIGLTATYFSYILVMSRISRVLSNIGFYKIYNKIKDKMCYYLPIACGIAFLSAFIGNLMPQMITKFTLMTIGFCIILGIRDIFSTYMQDLLLKNSEPSKQQVAISYLGLSRKIGETSISFIFSLMLLKVELIYVIVALVILSLISFIINFKLYKIVRSN